MEKIQRSLIGGLAGALALNIIHQAVKQFDHEAPRVDLVGEEALSKGLQKTGLTAPEGDALFAATLAADLLSNTAYYALIGCAKKKHLLMTGLAGGLAAGLGAVAITGKVGLSDAPVTRSNKTKLLTIAWYTIGGLFAAGTMRVLSKR